MTHLPRAIPIAKANRIVSSSKMDKNMELIITCTLVKGWPNPRMR